VGRMSVAVGLVCDVVAPGAPLSLPALPTSAAPSAPTDVGIAVVRHETSAATSVPESARETFAVIQTKSAGTRVTENRKHKTEGCFNLCVRTRTIMYVWTINKHNYVRNKFLCAWFPRVSFLAVLMARTRKKPKNRALKVEEKFKRNRKQKC
jgi:hypothetical protein